ncbi:hypothetical protein ACFB49_42970 [Sphingomonas sp. DBB INV C78]|uniref:DUF1643 domain-containing protein n=1 Tax=Sphingomonas sp. DBB INV C78 TaxID=3349434 RepID=UPI0036D2F4B9
MTDMFMEKAAEISSCGGYRYSLLRRWDPGAYVQPVIMLNPSTADAEIDDPTIKRCMAFARRENFGGIRVFNLFAYRATSPADMKAVKDPIGPKNDEALAEAFALSATPTLVAWGTDGGHLARAAAVCAIAKQAGASLVCLGMTKDGHPRHPLYVKGSQPFVPYVPPAHTGVTPE